MAEWHIDGSAAAVAAGNWHLIDREDWERLKFNKRSEGRAANSSECNPVFSHRFRWIEWIIDTLAW